MSFATFHWDAGWTALSALLGVFAAWRLAHSDNAVTRAFRGASFKSVTEGAANAAVALAARVEQLERQVVSLVEENKLLKELVTHSAKVDQLSKKIDEYQKVVEKAIGGGR